MTKIDANQVNRLQAEGYGYECAYGAINLDSEFGYIIGVDSGFYLIKNEEVPQWLADELAKETLELIE